MIVIRQVFNLCCFSPDSKIGSENHERITKSVVRSVVTKPNRILGRKKTNLAAKVRKEVGKNRIGKGTQPFREITTVDKFVLS